MELEFAKNEKKQGKFQLIETPPFFLIQFFALLSSLKLGCNDRFRNQSRQKNNIKIKFRLGLLKAFILPLPLPHFPLIRGLHFGHK
jgi:hypothetical protein